ncbi:kelch-like protein 17 [Bactrocera tryoni]|uniref:kelch-like protein 17 n=1 Tax=Bactrocera tryoni TaxID=59916 RepID=UPI001A96D70B|nr:kelch-like protein 17 [Bactrocera tryoni]
MMATSYTQRPSLQSNSSEQNRFMDKLMWKIFSFYDEQSLIDVTFKVSNPTALIPAHRLILAAASPYFENLFNGDQGNYPIIEITDIDSDIFERLITFCYTGQTLFTVSNVSAMLKAAIVLKLDDVITSCVDYLIAHINKFTLQAAYALERESRCEHLMQKIIEYETQNFVEISKSDEFLNFDFEKMQRILESVNLNITREEDAFDAINRWFNYNVPARQEQLPLLIACLRLTQFDADFLLTHIQPLPGCELLAFKAISWIREPAARTKINMRFTRPRGISAANCGEKTLLAVCGNEIYPKLLQYSKAEDKWQEYASISWNIRNKTWRNLAAMNQKRFRHCVVELDGKIYAIGGLDIGKTLSSVERYTTSDGWQFVNGLIVGRYDPCAVTLNGKIYIMSGINGDNDYIKSVECYNPVSNAWTSCADMIERHTFSVAAAHKGHVYVLGSYGDNRTVERYDPQQDTWSKICSLERWFISCVSLDNKLWAITGDFLSGMTCVSVYDEENDRWEQKFALPERNIHSLFVVPEALLKSNE